MCRYVDELISYFPRTVLQEYDVESLYKKKIDPTTPKPLNLSSSKFV